MIWVIVAALVGVSVALLFSGGLVPVADVTDYNSSHFIEGVDVFYNSEYHLFYGHSYVSLTIFLNRSCYGDVAVGHLSSSDDGKNILLVTDYVSFSRGSIVSVNTSCDLPLYVAVFDKEHGTYDAVEVNNLGNLTNLTHVTIDEIRKEDLFSKLSSLVLTNLKPIIGFLTSLLGFVFKILPYSGVLILLWVLLPLFDGNFGDCIDRILHLYEWGVSVFCWIIGLLRRLLPF